MTRSARPLLTAALAALLVLGTACTSNVAGAPAANPAPAPTEGPGSDPVPWVDRICGAVFTFASAATKPPDFAAAPDLPAVKQTASAYLGAVVAGAQQGKEQLSTLGRAPVTGGETAADHVRSGLDTVEQAFSAARAGVDGADPANADAFTALLTRTEATLNAVKTPDPMAEFATVPRLQRAAQQAQQCQQLTTLPTAH